MNVETKQEFNSFSTIMRGRQQSFWRGDEKNWGSMAYLVMKFMGSKHTDSKADNEGKNATYKYNT